MKKDKRDKPLLGSYVKKQFLLLFGIPLLFLFATTIFSAQITATWDDGATGNYNTASNWDGGVVPLNFGGNTYLVIIDGAGSQNTVVTANNGGTVDGITINSGDQLTIDHQIPFVVTASGAGAGTINNSGIIFIDADNTSVNRLGFGGGTVSVIGGGTITFDPDQINTRIHGTTATDRLVNVNNLIEGNGDLGANVSKFTNQHVIRANVNGETLDINPASGADGMINTGTMEATNGGSLRLEAGEYTNTGGLIQAGANSNVTLTSAKIEGGTINIDAPSSSVVVTANSTLDGAVSITAGGASADVDINNARFIILADESTLTLDSEVAITPNSVSSATGLNILAGTTAEVRGGSITFDNANVDQITGGAGAGYINNSYVNGYGNAGANILAITNSSSGVFDANVAGQRLRVDVVNTSTFNNLGTLRASNGGTLEFRGGMLTSPTGVVEAVDANSEINFSVATLVDDTTINLATSSNAVTFAATSTINDSVAFTGLGDVILNNAILLKVTSNTTINVGSGVEFKPAGSSNQTGFDVQSSKLTITGDGTIDFDHLHDVIAGSAGTVDNRSNIMGRGRVGRNGLLVLNNGLIEANDGSLEKMTLDVPTTASVDNNGTIRASNGIIEFLGGGSINSADGLMEATGNNSKFQFHANFIEDTTINLAATTSAHFDTDATLDGVSVVRTGVSNVTVDIDNGEFLVTVGDATVNFGEGVVVKRNQVGSQTGMNVVSGRLTLTGDGTHEMDHATLDVFTGTSGTLDNKSNIMGAGKVGNNVIEVVNNGLIEANISGQTMSLDQPNASTLDNNGTIRASNGGIIRVEPGAINSADGTFEATGANSEIELSSVLVQDTTFNLATASNAVQVVGNSTLNGTVAVTGLGDVNIDNNRFIVAASDTTLNVGSGVEIKPNQVSSQTGFSVQSSKLTLIGDGTVDFDSANLDVFTGLSGTLDNRANIMGAGKIGNNVIKVINSSGGLIEANVDGETLAFNVPDTQTFENSGTVRVSNGGVISFKAGSFNSASGIVEAVDADSTFELNGAYIEDTTFNLSTATNTVHFLTNSSLNGTVALTGLGKTTIANLRFMALDSVNVVNNTTIDPLASTTATGISVVSNSSLNGSGLFQMDHAQDSITGTSGVTFTQGAGHTISGYGKLGSNVISVINDGSILANVSGQTLTVDPINSGSFTNNGLLEATGGGVISIPAGGNQTNNGTIKASAGSSLTLDETWAGTTGNLIADAGTISIGAVEVHSTGNTGDTTISNGGAVIITGGTLNTGDLTISGATSSLSVASQVTVSGDFTFDTTDESLWTLGDGASDVLKMTGGVGASTTDAGAHASLEIGGTDLGTNPATHTGAPAGFDDNFDLTRLVIGTGARVKLTDTINNGNRGGVGGSAEALYVDTLEFEDATGILNLNGLHLYYTTLIGNISQIGDAFFDWIDGVTDAGTAYVSGVIGDLPSFEIDFTTVGDVVTTGNASVAQQNNPAALPEGKSYAVTAAGDEVVYSIAPTTAVVSGSFNFSIDTANLNLFGQDPSEAFLVHNSGTLQEFFEVASIDGTTLTFTVPTNFSDFGLGVNPEPATLILLGSGLLGLLPLRKRFFR